MAWKRNRSGDLEGHGGEGTALLNRHHHAERGADALRGSLWRAAPSAGKRRIGHADP